MTLSSARRLRIGIAIDTSTTWGTSLIRGIHGYAAEHGHWRFELAPSGRYESLRWKFPDKSFDGILARVTTLARAKALLKFQAPIVNVSSHDPTAGQIALCSVNMSMVGKLAANHFIERGFRDFGYVTISERRDNYLDQELEAYAGEIARRGCTLSIFESAKNSRSSVSSRDQRLVRWIRQLPHPVAVLAWNSWEARRTSDACQAAGRSVPESVAILSGEHDELSCSINSPALSSVDCAGDSVGWRAAQLLDCLMRGDPPPQEPIRIEPRGILLHASTDILAVDDAIVAEALAFIREHALEGITVADVVRHVPLRRRGLEERFRQILDRSPLEEIRYARVQHARELLAATNFTIKRIAHAAAFGDENALNRAFQHFFGETPSAYRRRIRLAQPHI